MIKLVLLILLTTSYIIYFYYWIKAFRISAPYYPTSRKAIVTLLSILKKNKPKHIIEIGAGDGKVAVALARNGYEVTAVEFNPILVLFIYFKKSLYMLKNLHVRRANFLDIDYSEFDSAFIYLYPQVMDQLSKKIKKEMPQNSVIISNTFQFHDRQPISIENCKLYVYSNAK